MALEAPHAAECGRDDAKVEVRLTCAAVKRIDVVVCLLPRYSSSVACSSHIRAACESRARHTGEPFRAGVARMLGGLIDQLESSRLKLVVQPSADLPADRPEIAEIHAEVAEVGGRGHGRRRRARCAAALGAALGGDRGSLSLHHREHVDEAVVTPGRERLREASSADKFSGDGVDLRLRTAREPADE